MTSDRWWRCKRIAKKEESSLPSSKAQTPKWEEKMQLFT
jgi:hypothetical protein